MITVWTLDPRQEPRYTDTACIQPWTAKALLTLEGNTAHALFAAMPYCSTNSHGFNLIDDQSVLTPQGKV